MFGLFKGLVSGKKKSRRNKTARTKHNKHHNVYVVELNPDVLKNKKFLSANPGYRAGKLCVYVGMTGLTPEERFQNHLRGYKSNYFVKRYGIRLLPHLFAHYNPMSYEDAGRMEVKLADKLRRKGYGVWQN